MEVLQCYHVRHSFNTKPSNLFYSVKLGSVEVPCGGLELLKWEKNCIRTAIRGSHLSWEAAACTMKYGIYVKPFEIWTMSGAPYASEPVHFVVNWRIMFSTSAKISEWKDKCIAKRILYGGFSWRRKNSRYFTKYCTTKTDFNCKFFSMSGLGGRGKAWDRQTNK